MSHSYQLWRLVLIGSTSLHFAACGTLPSPSGELDDDGVSGDRSDAGGTGNGSGSGDGSGIADAGGSGDGSGTGDGSGSGSGSDAGGPLVDLPARLDLGAVDCGGSASATFDLANRGRSVLTYSFA